ncbi:MAG TPA: hypothetical protein VGS19_01395 [Streptosporangiaceae bacterium]|nr:hypothetical protein [Streptosporangiaceae bacterium]
MRFSSARFGVPAVVAAGASVALAVGLLLPAAASAKSAPAPKKVTDWVTLYGFVDNSPPGRAIAHPGCPNGGHQLAGGVGTFANPVSFAQVGANGPWCQVIYIPYLKKYFIHEDQCGGNCGGQPNNHVDVWAGGNGASVHNPEKAALLACENKWTQTNTVILNPPANEPVDTTRIFIPPTTCHGP